MCGMEIRSCSWFGFFVNYKCDICVDGIYDKEFLYFRLLNFYPHIYVTLSYLNLYARNFSGRKNKKKIVFFCLFWLALMDGKNSIFFFLSSTNKTLGECGCGCVPHPSELKKIIMTCGGSSFYTQQEPFWLGFVNCIMKEVFLFFLIFRVLSFRGQFWRFKFCKNGKILFLMKSRVDIEVSYRSYYLHTPTL